MKPSEPEEKRPVSRRSFLSKSAATAGLAALPISRFAHAAGSDEMKVALIGCGGRGSGALRQTLMNEGTKVVAVADAFKDKAMATRKGVMNASPKQCDIPEDRVFAGFDAYKQAIEVADVVLLATSPGFRPIHFEAAINAGKHVFMEKPVATDMPGIRKVLDAAKMADEKNLKVVVGLQRHYQKNYNETLKQINDGAIGDITSGRVQWNSGGVWVRDRAKLELAAGRKLTEMEYQMRNWYYFAWLCGDHITEQHVHNLDVANWFLGELPERCEGMGGREVRQGNADYGEIFDHHYVVYKYPSGAQIHSQCRHIRGAKGGVYEEFTGTKGRVLIEGQKSRIFDHKGKQIWGYYEREDANPYEVEHQELWKAIRNDTPLNNAYYGATSTRNAIMGRLATYGGKEITTEAAMQSNLSLMPEGDLTMDSMPKVVPGENGLYPASIPGKSKVL